MKYPPGSFSKNFAWHGTGLKKLHAVIRDGFQDSLASVGRQSFRDKSRLDASLSLIPVNFFLHNRGGHISVDELVFQALQNPHSTRFDRLGLFALHLNRAGTGDRVVERPAMWANEFVRERLWSDGTWQSSTLADIPIDSFIKDRMDGEDDVRVKCRNNYRHLFKLCGYWPSSMSLINSGAEHWITSALFLAWDRHILSGGSDDKAFLLALIDSDELHKLLGVTPAFAAAHAKRLVDLYISVECIDRFLKLKKEPAVESSADTTKLVVQEIPEVPEEGGLEWLGQQESDETVARRAVERQEQKRDRKKAAALKKHYNNTCMFCGTRLQVSEDDFYSEAAHLKGLGEPHNGPDKVSNMVVLCPNHHIQFDRGILRLYKDGPDYRIKSKIAGDPLDGKAIALTHSVNDSYVQYHYKWFK